MFDARAASSSNRVFTAASTMGNPMSMGRRLLHGLGRAFVRAVKHRAPRTRASRISFENPLVVGGSPTGASFNLDRPAARDAVEILAHGWTAHLTSGSTQVVVRGPGNIRSYDDALIEAVAAAQEGLDLLAMRGAQARVIEAVDSHHVVWWTNTTSRRTLRIMTVSDAAFSTSATATVTDAQGRVKPPPPPPALPWHESLRYFRLAQVTGDLFDAYRNLYLALESLLSSAVPQQLNNAGKPSEGERQWLERALKAVDGYLPLAPYAPPGTGHAVDRMLVDVYAGTRTQLFHAKSGRPILLPHGVTSRDSVVESLQRLSRFFLDLFRHQMGYTRPSGVITHAGFELMTAYEATATFSDDSSPAEKADVSINPRGGQAVTMKTHRSTQLSKPGLTFWMAERDLAPRDALRQVLVRRVGLKNDDGRLIQVERMKESVDLDGVDTLQLQQGARLVNVQQPRFRFIT